jgi:hypothetical protein
MTRLAALVLLLAIATTTHGAAPASPNPLGVNGTPRGLTGAYPYAQELGFGWVRVFFTWSDLQPTPAPPDFDAPVLTAPCGGWPAESARDIVAAAGAAGFSVLVNVSSPPCWATAGGGTGRCHNKAPLAAPWQAFLTSLVQALGPGIAAYEIWNEPNFDVNWTATPAQWTDSVLVPAFDAIKAADPQALVVAPAIMTGSFYKPQKSSRVGDWLQSGGALARPIDAVTFHAYANDPRDVKAQVKAPDAFARANGIPEVWMTEFGFSTPGLGPRTACPHCGPSATDCAADVTNVFALLPSPGSSRLARIFYYTLSDRTKPYCVKGCGPGLLSVDGTPKLPLTRLLRAPGPR